MRALLFLPHASVTTLKTFADAFRNALWRSHVYGVILHSISKARVVRQGCQIVFFWLGFF